MSESERSANNIQKEQIYILKLYVADGEQNSRIARENLESICDEYLKGRCQVIEIDVMTDFASALRDRVFVTPALVLLTPVPMVTVIGNLGDKEKVISALRLRI